MSGHTLAMQYGLGPIAQLRNDRGEVAVKSPALSRMVLARRRLQTTRLPALVPDKIINSIANQFPGKKVDWLEKFL